MVQISIIVPVFNAATWLRECLDSIMAQTFGNWRCVCVDDGSTDGSDVILNEYAARDGRFEIIHQRNMGPAAARNAALDIATGDWIMFVDADDELHRQTLEIAVGLITDQVDAVSFWHAESINELTVEGIAQEIPDPLFDPHYRGWRWWKGTVIWGRLWRRSVVGDIRFPTDRSNGEDTIWCARALSRVRKEIETSAKLYYYRPYNGLSRNSNAWRNCFLAWPDLYRINRHFAKLNGPGAWQTLRAHFCLETIINIRKGVAEGYISLELLTPAKKLVFALLGIFPRCSRKQFVLCCLYWFGIDAAFYWLNRKAKRTLVFHNVLPDSLADVALSNGGCMSLADLKLVVRELSRRFSFSTNVFDPESVTLTFDDGYRNQYSVAYKYLSSMGIPAYLFGSEDAMAGKILAIDKISLWFATAPIECIPGGNRHEFWNEVLWPRYCQDGMAKGVNVLKWLDGLYPFDRLFASMPERFRFERIGGISGEELDEMRKHGWIIGWHTKTHSPLSTLTDAESREELTPPEGMKGLPMSYPYGSEDLVGERERICAKELGYKCAFSNTHESRMNSSPYFMPRMHIWNFNKYDIHYEMSGLRYFVKHHRLLCCKKDVKQ